MGVGNVSFEAAVVFCGKLEFMAIRPTSRIPRLARIGVSLAIGALLAWRPAFAQTAPAVSNPSSGFVHPGLLHSQEDLNRIRDNVKRGEEPWAGAWQAFRGNRWISKTYTPRPLEIVGRGVGATGQDNISNDCTAAYYNALAWYVTGDESYAQKSIEIMNAWSYKCKLINGKDAVLCAGIYGYKLMNAAEIIRCTYKGWPEKDVAQFKTLTRDVFYPVLKDFSTFANGNWDGAADATMISIAVFLDDRAMFDRAARYYMDGSGDGSVLHYVIDDGGQLQESGRDQAHAQLGIGMISCVAEVAYHQGVDLYAAYDNRLLKGFEYTAKYNLKEQVPFEPRTDRTGKYVHQRISAAGSPTTQIYEMVYNHYVNVAGVEAPYTARAAAWRRPEPLAVDQVGGGTLLFTRPPYKAPGTVSHAPAIPGPVIAKGSAGGIALLWPASVNATAYTVKRAAAPDGPWEVVAKDIKGVTFQDKTGTEGKLYYYRVSASNAAGNSGDTLASGASAGLPAPWTMADIGDVPVKGGTLFDGSTFTLEASGANIAGKADQLHFASVALNGDGVITARYVPQTPSQFAKMGLMMRESTAADSPHVAFLIAPQATQDIEVPLWHVALLTRPKAGEDISVSVIGDNLDAPYVTWGRLMAPFWLRLARTGDAFTAAFSPDGRTWKPVGAATLPLAKILQVGLAGCSSIKVSTTIMFDNVSAPGWPAGK